MKRPKQIHIIHKCTGMPLKQLASMTDEEINLFYSTVSSWKDGEETA